MTNPIQYFVQTSKEFSETPMDDKGMSGAAIDVNFGRVGRICFMSYFNAKKSKKKSKKC